MTHRHPETSAHVDLVTSNNVTFIDAFQFDPPPGITGVTGGTGPYWTMDNKKFRLDIQGNEDQGVLLSLLSDNGEIVVDSTTLRIVHMNVPKATLNAVLVPGDYEYNFRMYDDTVSPTVEWQLMHGTFTLEDGVGS